MEFKKPRLYILEGNDIEWIYVRPISENRFATAFNLSMAIGPDPEPDYPTKHYAAECLALDLGSQGSDSEDAKSMICEAIKEFICSCLECKCLDLTLKGFGFVSAEIDVKPALKMPKMGAWQQAVPVQGNKEELALYA